MLGELARLRDRHRADPFAVREQVVRMSPDNQVDMALDTLGQLRVDRRNLEIIRHPPVAEVGEADHELGSLRTQLTSTPEHGLDLVPGPDSVVEPTVDEAQERIGDADEADPIDQLGVLHAFDRSQVCEEQRITRGTRLVGYDLRAIAEPGRVSDGGSLTAGRREEAVHRHALRQVGDPGRRLLHVARVDVNHAMGRLSPDEFDKCRHAREALDPTVNVVRVKDRDPHRPESTRGRHAAYTDPARGVAQPG